MLKLILEISTFSGISCFNTVSHYQVKGLPCYLPTKNFTLSCPISSSGKLALEKRRHKVDRERVFHASFNLNIAPNDLPRYSIGSYKSDNPRYYPAYVHLALYLQGTRSSFQVNLQSNYCFK